MSETPTIPPIVNRTVVGIDGDGVVRYYRRGMPPTDEIIAALTGAADR